MSHYDVIVIGGGVSGCSVSELLTAEGYSVLLVERGDFASEASGRSSRLLHCGLRYLTPKRSPFEFLANPQQFWGAANAAMRSSKAGDEFLAVAPATVRRTPDLFDLDLSWVAC